MKKAILVIDNPINCESCGICASYQEYAGAPRHYWCPLHTDKEVDVRKKPEWCPLKDMPEKDNESYFPDEYQDGHKDGYNALIDELLGNENTSQEEEE